MKRSEKCTEYLKYEFSHEEAGENAQTLARKNRSLAEFALKKKQLSSDLKNEEDAINADIAKLARFVTDGYDFRMIECGIRYDDPKDGMKTVFRIDTGEVVRTERMTDDEKQRDLPFADPVQRPEGRAVCPVCNTTVPLFEGLFGDHGIVRGATGQKELCEGSRTAVSQEPAPEPAIP